jgi:hypothetical protein
LRFYILAEFFSRSYFAPPFFQAGRLQGVTHSEAETLAAAFKSLRDELEGFVSRYRYN